MLISKRRVYRSELSHKSVAWLIWRQMIGIDGIAVINVVTNPSDAEISGKKKLQSKITHNDGGTWKPLTPPAKDSLGEEYECKTTVSGRSDHGRNPALG